MSKPYLTFASNTPFAVEMDSCWDGVVEYSTNTTAWSEWDGTELMSAEHDGEHRIYMRGTGNTTFEFSPFILSGEAIRCEGNIENLLDYATVANGEHPIMGEYCFASLFEDCANLITAPELPSPVIMFGCYNYMFANSGLTVPSDLPASLVADEGYSYMFSGCVGIKLSKSKTDEYWKPYILPSSGLIDTDLSGASAFDGMFEGTGGTFTGTPTANTIYYMAAPKEEPPTEEMSTGKKFLLHRMFSEPIANALTGEWF